MNKKLLIGLSALVIVIGLGFFFYSKSSPNTDTQNSQSVSMDPNTISIEDLSFNPDILTVKEGDKVTWVNNENLIHNIKSETFESEDLSKNDKFEFTFDEKGTFNYSCGIHPEMQGRVVVE
jgi:plastocyanin